MARKNKNGNGFEEVLEVRFSGSGGQGLLLAATIYAYASVVFDGKNAVQTTVYGSQSRGGESKSDIVISKGEIDHPKALNLDLLLALTQVACDNNGNYLKEEKGILVVDSELVDSLPNVTYSYSLPLTQIAREVGNSIVVNIVSLGAVSVVAPHIVPAKALIESIKAKVPSKFLDLNLRAFNEGAKAAEKLLKENVICN